MKIAIAGSRHYNDYEQAAKYIGMCLDNISATEKHIIISGGCKGADAIGERFAKEKGYEIQFFLAEWDKYGKAAGIVRNKKIAEAADIIICFWDEKSKGTKSLIEYAKELKKTIFVYRISE